MGSFLCKRHTMFLQVLHLHSNTSYTFSSKGVSNKLYLIIDKTPAIEDALITLHIHHFYKYFQEWDKYEPNTF